MDPIKIPKTTECSLLLSSEFQCFWDVVVGGGGESQRVSYKHNHVMLRIRCMGNCYYNVHRMSMVGGGFGCRAPTFGSECG